MALAKVCWVPEIEGGLKIPFTGSRYSTVARFEDDKSWPNEAWSLVVDFNEPANSSHCLTADVHFLVTEAPVHLLTKGSKFELYEGRNCVARGEVLADQRSARESLTT